MTVLACLALIQWSWTLCSGPVDTVEVFTRSTISQTWLYEGKVPGVECSPGRQCAYLDARPGALYRVRCIDAEGGTGPYGPASEVFTQADFQRMRRRVPR